MPDATLKHDEEIEHKFWWDIECLKLKWREARDEQQSSPERRDTINLLLSQIESNTPTAFDIERFDAWRKTLGSQGSTVFKLAADELGKLVLPVARDAAINESSHEPPWLDTADMARALASLEPGKDYAHRMSQLRDASKKRWLSGCYRKRPIAAKAQHQWHPTKTFEAFIARIASTNEHVRQRLIDKANAQFSNNVALSSWAKLWDMNINGE